MTASSTYSSAPTALARGIGPWAATALNVTFIVGAGVFVTIPLMLKELPGPYAMLAWIAAGLLILADGLVWCELGAALPGSGGTYQYLLECYGPSRWGRLMAFLYVWQFLISAPLELGSGLAAIAQFAPSLSPEFATYNLEHTWTVHLWQAQGLAVVVNPARLLAVGLGFMVIVLLWRNVTTLGRITVTFWLGVMAVIGWILIEGALRFDPARAFDTAPTAGRPVHLGTGLGAAMLLALYSYLGYYNVCNIGDEVRDPGRTIPRSILGSVAIVCVLFLGLHLAMLGTIPWREVPTDSDNYSLAAEFMRRIHGNGAATVVTVLLIWSCLGSVFAGMFGYSRVPYAAARNGHFFSIFARVHPEQRIPHLALALVGGLTLLWGFFGLDNLIKALITTRIIEQFIGQAVGVVLLRRRRPDLYRPFKMWLYPLPSLLALTGWLYVYLSTDPLFIYLGAGTMVVGAIVFLLWSRHKGEWPFAAANATKESTP